MAHYITQECTGCTACTAVCPTQAIRGGKKEIHCIEEALCMDCGACGRACPAHCVEDAFGTPVPRLARKKWPKPEFDMATCISCGICIETCPTQALSTDLMVVRDRHAYPWLENKKACIACGFCVDDCPVDAVALVLARTETGA